MRMKDAAVEGAVHGMLDAGLAMPRERIHQRIWEVYGREGIEDQQVLDRVLEAELGRVDHKILAAGIVATAGPGNRPWSSTRTSSSRCWAWSSAASGWPWSPTRRGPRRGCGWRRCSSTTSSTMW